MTTRTYEKSNFEFPEFASLARGCSEKVSDVSEVSGNGEHPMDFERSGGAPMLNNVRHAPEREGQLPPPSLPSPRVRVRQTEDGHAVEPALDETLELDEFRIRFVGAFGTTEEIIADALFQQIVNALHPDPKKPLDTATANLVLALLHRIGPRDELEAMLASQMIVAHVAAMDASRRALHVEQTPGRTPGLPKLGAQADDALHGADGRVEPAPWQRNHPEDRDRAGSGRSRWPSRRRGCR